MTRCSPARHAVPQSDELWTKRATYDISEFLRTSPLVAKNPHAQTTLHTAAMLVWEGHRSDPSWSALPISELFRRLRVEQEFLVDPEKVVATYEILHMFVPWLLETQRISARTSDQVVDALMDAKVPLVDDARKLLRARRAALERHGVWHEILRTMGGP